jgi:hypothetical protein
MTIKKKENLVEHFAEDKEKQPAKKQTNIYLNPESFYNLFIGRENWKDIYFKKTIVSRKSF